MARMARKPEPSSSALRIGVQQRIAAGVLARSGNKRCQLQWLVP